MAGQLWTSAAEGGYLYSDELSDHLRLVVQPRCKFRQLCDAQDGSQKGLNRGETFTWDIISDLGTSGRRLDERQPIPETGFTISQGSMTVYEAGNSVPLTQRLTLMAKHDVTKIIDRVLRDDCVKFHDREAFLEFKSTPLRVAPTSGTSTTSVTLTTNGATATTNNVALGSGHVKAMSDLMKERNIPAYRGDDYVAIGWPTTFRQFKNDIETVKQYTETGLSHIFSGEIGRYEGFRFVEQTNIPKGGANDSTTYDVFGPTADAWDNGKSDWCLFMGADTVTECDVVMEEIRAKIPGDFGRSRGIAWYFLGGYKIIHSTAAQARVLLWDSAA